MRGTARSHVLVGILVLVVRVVRIYRVRNYLQSDFGIGVKCSADKCVSLSVGHTELRVHATALRKSDWLLHGLNTAYTDAAIGLHILLDTPKVLVEYRIEARIAFGTRRTCVESTASNTEFKRRVILARCGILAEVEYGLVAVNALENLGAISLVIRVDRLNEHIQGDFGRDNLELTLVGTSHD